jgi:hypothetical protein
VIVVHRHRQGVVHQDVVHQGVVHQGAVHQGAVHQDVVVAEDAVVNIFFCQQDYFLVFRYIYIKKIWKN